MDVRLINPFIDATVTVLSTMAQTTPVPGKPEVKKGNKTWGAVTGIIGLAGSNVTGNLVLSFDEASILDIVGKMLFEQFTEVNQDIIDAVGEITNMISGGTKKSLSEFGFNFDMATPVILVGREIEITQLTRRPVILLPFTTPKGRFVLEANISER